MKAGEKESTLVSFARCFAEYAEKDESFVMLAAESEADSEITSLLPQDKIIFADNAAGSVILSAAGLAVEGRRPWVMGRAADLVAAGYAQIREAVALPGLPVRLVAVNGGLSSAREGASAQFLEDIALMRSMPEMELFVPADENDIRCVLEKSRRRKGPLYLRLSRTPAPLLEGPAGEDFKIGGARILSPGTGVTICACGIMVSQAVEAAEKLKRQNISAEVIDCCSLKPFPEQLLLSSVRKTGCCVTAEEHSTIGGLFGAAAECLGRTCPVPMRSVAVADQFVNSGTPEELHGYYGLTWQEIVDAAAEVWALRRR